MKYYTKQWNKMLQNTFHLDMFKIIPDGIYSEQKIHDFYERELKAFIEQERTFYEKNAHIPICDGLCQNTFDQAEAAAQFKTAYVSFLNMVSVSYPEWVKNEVDLRLLAMRMMPEGIYKRLKLQEKESRKAFQRMDSKAEKETEIQWDRIPAEIRAVFRIGGSPVLEEACLLSVGHKDHDILFIFRYGEWQKPADCITPYLCITFKNAELLENEAEIQISRVNSAETESIISDCMYVRDELYLVNDSFYEYHLMVSGSSYVTVSCEHIVEQQNYSFQGEL